MLIRPVAQRAARMPVTIIIFSYMVWFLALSERQPFTNNRMIWRLQVDSHFKFGRCSFAQLGGLGTPAKRSLSSVQANRQRTCRLHTRCTTRVLPLAGGIGFLRQSLIHPRCFFEHMRSVWAICPPVAFTDSQPKLSRPRRVKAAIKTSKFDSVELNRGLRRMDRLF